MAQIWCTPRSSIESMASSKKRMDACTSASCEISWVSNSPKRKFTRRTGQPSVSGRNVRNRRSSSKSCAVKPSLGIGKTRDLHCKFSMNCFLAAKTSPFRATIKRWRVASVPDGDFCQGCSSPSTVRYGGKCSAQSSLRKWRTLSAVRVRQLSMVHGKPHMVNKPKTMTVSFLKFNDSKQTGHTFTKVSMIQNLWTNLLLVQPLCKPWSIDTHMHIESLNLLNGKLVRLRMNKYLQQNAVDNLNRRVAMQILHDVMETAMVNKMMHKTKWQTPMGRGSHSPLHWISHSIFKGLFDKAHLGGTWEHWLGGNGGHWFGHLPHYWISHSTFYERFLQVLCCNIHFK